MSPKKIKNMRIRAAGIFVIFIVTGFYFGIASEGYLKVLDFVFGVSSVISLLLYLRAINVPRNK